MLACDFILNFIFISCGWEGSASDAGVLRSAISKEFSVPKENFILYMVGMQIHHPLLSHAEELGITSASLDGIVHHKLVM
jgi:hypothetical protein